MRWGLLIFLLGACIARAEEACPWMNAATAAGILGGDVTFSVTHPSDNGDDASCLFTHGSGHLSIEVQTKTPPYKLECGANPAPVKAMGNEAVSCSTEAKNGMRTEQVVGRVRDRVFRTRIDTQAFSRDALREKAHTAAEIVSGNLF